MKLLTCSAMLLVALAAPPAAANDGIAAYGLGGVEMAQSRDIRIVREDLAIRTEEIRVRYEFRNEGKVDITALVAFPLPPFSADSWYKFNPPIDTSTNYVGFTVAVDGRPVEPQVQTRATVSGVDITKLLTALDVPLVLPGLDLDQTISAFGDERWQQLAASGAVDAYAPDRLLEALWQIETLFYWTQTFPVGTTVAIEHSYKPIKGGFYLSQSDYLDQVADPAGWPRYYCIDDTAGTPLRAAIAAAGRESPRRADTVDYVLMTAHTWAGTIGTFHLTIDTGAPGALLSLCQDGLGETGLQQTGPTSWETTLSDWLPTRDLAIFLLRPE